MKTVKYYIVKENPDLCKHKPQASEFTTLYYISISVHIGRGLVSFIYGILFEYILEYTWCPHTPSMSYSIDFLTFVNVMFRTFLNLRQNEKKKLYWNCSAVRKKCQQKKKNLDLCQRKKKSKRSWHNLLYALGCCRGCDKRPLAVIVNEYLIYRYGAMPRDFFIFYRCTRCDFLSVWNIITFIFCW